MTNIRIVADYVRWLLIVCVCGFVSFSLSCMDDPATASLVARILAMMTLAAYLQWDEACAIADGRQSYLNLLYKVLCFRMLFECIVLAAFFFINPFYPIIFHLIIGGGILFLFNITIKGYFLVSLVSGEFSSVFFVYLLSLIVGAIHIVGVKMCAASS